MTIDNSTSHTAIHWQAEPHLQRNFDLYKTRHEKFRELLEQKSEPAIVLFWLNMALHNLPLKQPWEAENRIHQAWQHLSIYCEESCYRAASQVWKDNKYKSWEEYIFIARCLIYDDDKFQAILSKYNPSNSQLYTYITEVLRKTIKDESTVAKFSKWRLLCKKSNKELREALIRDGKVEPEISRCLFARQYFKQVYQFNKIQNPLNRSGKRWLEPDINDFEEATQFYNSEKLLAIAPHEVAVGKDISAKQLQAWIEICIQALQNYPHSITPSVSLELMSAVGREIEVNSCLFLEVEDNSIEEDSFCQRIGLTLKNDLMALNIQQQEILYLYYGLGWNQKQIATKFGVTQGAIARRLQTIERQLTQAIYKLNQPSAWVKNYILKWLKYNYETPDYSDLVHAALVVAVKKLNPDIQDILKLSYGQKLDIDAISNHIGISSDIICNLLDKANLELEAILLQEIDAMINEFLNAWLAKEYKKIHKSNLRLTTQQLIST
jgi:RNA polymerase sigma factor (sigma-70 family)